MKPEAPQPCEPFHPDDACMNCHKEYRLHSAFGTCPGHTTQCFRPFRVAAQPEPEAAQCPRCDSDRKKTRNKLPWGDCNCGSGEGCSQHSEFWMKDCSHHWHDAAPSESVAPKENENVHHSVLDGCYSNVDRLQNGSHATKVAQPTPPQVDPDVRNRAGLWMLRHGVKMGVKVDPGDVQTLVTEFAQAEVTRLATENQRLTRERNFIRVGRDNWRLRAEEAEEKLARLASEEPQGETK